MVKTIVLLLLLVAAGWAVMRGWLLLAAGLVALSLVLTIVSWLQVSKVLVRPAFRHF